MYLFLWVDVPTPIEVGISLCLLVKSTVEQDPEDEYNPLFLRVLFLSTP